MNFSSFFITRPIFAAVLSLLIVIAGALSLLRLPISEYPERRAADGRRARRLSPAPTPRSSPRPSPRRSSSRSTASRACSTCPRRPPPTALLTLTITFALGTDLDNAQVQVQNRVAQALPQLPEEVQRIGVTTEKASPDLIMVVHLVSPDDRYDMLYLSNYAHLQVKDELPRIDGVGDVQVFGAGEYSMRVWLDPDKLAARAADRRPTSCAAIREQNVQVAAGVLGAPPAPTDTTFQLSINAQGRLTTEEEFGDIVVRATPNGQITRLRDVARVELGVEPLRAAQPARQPAGRRHRHLPAAGHQRAAGVRRRARADGAAEGQLSRRRRLPHRLRPDGLRARVDPTPSSRRCSRRSCWSCIVVMVFLQTWRASIIPLVAVPVSLDRHVRGDAARSASRSTRCRCSAWCWPSASSSTTPSWWSRTSSATSSWACRRSRRPARRWTR